MKSTLESAAPVPAVLLNLFRSVGAMHAFTISSSMDLAARTQILRQVKESGAFREVAPSWEVFCKEHLPWARRTIDEDIRFLDRLGEEFIQAAAPLGLGRRQLRALSSVPTDLLPHAEENEIVVGDERVPLDQKDRVLELLENLVTKQELMEARLSQGEAQLQKKNDEVQELRNELQAAEDRQEGRITSPFAQVVVRAMRLLREAADLLNAADPADRPQPTEVLAFVRALNPTMSELIHYGGQYVTPAWITDAEELAKHLEGVTAEGTEPGTAEGEEDPFANAPEIGEWGDEDELL